MGTIWRASKSRLVCKIRNAKNEEERLRLKPDNIKSTKEWKNFVKSKTSSDFEVNLFSEKDTTLIFQTYCTFIYLSIHILGNKRENQSY